MTVEQLIQMVQSVGFPILVCFWFMWRVERRLDAVDKQQHIITKYLAGDKDEG